MKYIFTFLLLFFAIITPFAQVGINTTTPQGTLDIVTNNNTGVVLPRVSRIEDVSDGAGGTPINGTTVYDISRSTTCFYQNDKWTCIGEDGDGDPILIDPLDFDLTICTYIKASNTDPDDRFGHSIAVSDDGKTLAVGTNTEASNGTGINSGAQGNNSAPNSGAVYVFTNIADTWAQEAFIKSSNAAIGDYFGFSVALSEDGTTLAVGATFEDSNGTGVNSGTQNDNSSVSSGAVYVFTKSGGGWMQEAYIKPSNTDIDDQFGFAVSLSNDGNALVVSTPYEDSSGTGVNGGGQSDNSAMHGGAAYIFTKSGGIWAQEAYVKASNTETVDLFGISISLSGDGNTLVVGAEGEDSNGVGVNSGAQANNNAPQSGAIYIFTKTGGVWSQEAYIKSSNPDNDDRFGHSVTLSDDGNTMAASSESEDSNGTGVNNGAQADNSTDNSGAVYLFVKSGGNWSQEAYIKASNTDINDNFGNVLVLSGDGLSLSVSAYFESSNGTGINSNSQADNSAPGSGAVYVFSKNQGAWSQNSYVKASNTDAGDLFGWSLAVSKDASTIAVGAVNEDSNGTGVNSGTEADNSANSTGAVYLVCKNK